jgi:formate hydrogenlyase subunit 3/multisubunit Na+/H+ antiporter MnhD subunit
MNGIDWSAITPAVMVAAILSITLEWFPGLSTWWEGLSSRRKTTINALLVALISGGSVYGNCRLWSNVCPVDAWAAVGEIVITFLLAAAANQGVYAMSRKEVLAGRE